MQRPTLAPRFALLMFSLILIASPAGADEGMWPLYDLDKLDFAALRDRGLELSPRQLHDPAAPSLSDAVLSLGGGTASFVSAEGLIVTNHHVAFGAIQRQSTVDQHYLRDGFTALTRAEEIPAPGYHAYVPLASEDVTPRVFADLGGDLDDRARYQAIEMAIKRIVKEAEAGRDVKCHVAKMHGGTQFVLYTQLEIKDLRIVHVPPASIGKYGGDIDNWMWPRHTGDYSFLRAYVAPDGTSAEYDAANLPFRPRHYLPFAGGGVAEGDLTLVIGFPGRTQRYVSSFLIDEMLNTRYPEMIQRMEEVLAILEGAAGEKPEYALRLASRMSGLNNYLKNSYGMVQGFERSGILDEKREAERQLSLFLAENPGADRHFGNVLAELAALYAARAITRRHDAELGSLSRGSEFYGMASRIWRWAVEGEQPDLERDRGYQDRDRPRARKRLEVAQINLLPEIDQRLLRYSILHVLSLPADQRIAAVDSIFAAVPEAGLAAALDAWLASAYSATAIGDQERRLAMFDMNRAELEALGDPFIDLARALDPEAEASRERRKRFSGAETRLAPKLIAAYAAWKQGRLYPDANGTRRFNVGEVRGFGPCEDPRWDYLTTLTGLLAKETGADPFIVPDELKRASAAAGNSRYADRVCRDLPVNFLTTNDSTGGNSGSPVVNGRGELVGLLFDGNYEAVTADYLFEPATARSIMVDVRYVLWLLEDVYQLAGLVAELTVK